MLIYDFSGIALSTITVEKNLNEGMIRHMILNTIRMYRKKFPKSQYGDVIIACDGANSWRREAFPQYKASRRKGRDTSTFNWEEAFRILNLVREELRDNFPYKVIHVDRCEADDVIGTLVENTHEFGNYEEVMIISADNDFVQLQKYGNVKQFSPLLKKFVKDDNPKLKMITHIIRGDKGDGVPNILSDDNVFVEDRRQTTISAKKFDEIAEALTGDHGEAKTKDWYRNYERNRLLVNLEYTPDIYKKEILKCFGNQDTTGKGAKILPFLIDKKCKILIEVAAEFI